jgi:iron complex outermembrane receptor protein
MIVAALPSAAFAQTTDPNQATQPDPNAPAAATSPTPGEPNAPQPKTPPGPNANTGDEGAIVVTGIRRSLQDSIQIKRNSASVVEAVSAEEIGKLPDVSIAESIARLPGIAAQRVNGRAEIISIRGFSPDFTTVLLNGRQQASSGYNRAVEFDQYPSELMGSVVVYKTPDASIAGMGLAGTVDLRTIRPLEYGKRAIALNLRGQYDQGGGRNRDFSKYGWRGSASYIDQNSSGTLGWMMSYAHLDAPSHVNETKNWNFWVDYGDGIQTMSGEEIRATNSRDIRDGVTGTLEFKPSDSVHSVLDLYYSRFKQKTTTRGAEWFASAWTDNVTYTNVQTKTIDGVPFQVGAHVSNVTPQLRWDDNPRTDHLFSAGLNNDFRLAEHTHLLADLSYSSNKRHERDTELFGGYGCCGPQNADGTHPRVFDSYDRVVSLDNNFLQDTNFGLDYADASQVSLGDRAAWTGYGYDGHTRTPHIKETLGSGDLTLRQDFDGTGIGRFFTSVEAGLDYTRRHKNKTVGEWDLFLKNDRLQALVDPQFLTDPTSLSFAGDMSVLGVKATDLLNNGNYYDVVPLENSDHFDKAWDIKEDILTWKAKATIDYNDLHGNVGVQVVQQKQRSSGVRIDTSVFPIAITPVDEGAKYTDVLPSLNLYYDLDRHNRLRFAAAKVMARPRMDDMRANLVPSFDGSVCEIVIPPNKPCAPGVVVHPWSAGGGNPKLEPWRAKEIDIGYEWYGGKASYFSVHGWYMWLDNYIYTQVIPLDFTGVPAPSADLARLEQTCNGCTISPIGSLTAPANGKGGWLRGIEVSGAFEFGRVARILDGFGATGSISYTTYKLDKVAVSNIGGLNANYPVLPGFSKWVYDLTGYYEKNGFQARASWRHRSKYEGEVIALFTNLSPTLTQPDEQVDAQIGYTFQPGSRLNGLGIVLQVSNVLDSPYRTYVPVGPNSTPILERFEKYGRSWLLGASYHF